MFVKNKSSMALLCTVGVLYSGLLMSASTTVYAETVEISVNGTDRLSVISKAIQKRLTSKFRKLSKSKKRRRGVMVQYYADANYKPIWLDADGLNNKAQSLLKVIEHTPSYGLTPSDFQLRYAKKSLDKKTTPGMMARVELELSLAALKYMDVARNGRFDPKKLSRFMEGTTEKIDGVKALGQLSSTVMVMNYLEGYNPSHPQFKALRKELLALGGSAGKAVKVIRMPSKGPVLKEGMIHSDVVVLRKRLEVTAPENKGEELFNPALYDKELADAVARFQESKDLKGDSVVGSRTRLALNEGMISAKQRKAVILANMERWRWLPDQLGEKHILVNIPEYQVRVFSGDKVIHKERVIVGKLANKTPFFSDKMEKVVFNPYWNVPQSIIANEMNYSIPRGYEGHYNNGMLHVRQPPGPRNALGKVKFLFPNKHAVYLHDTPSKSLFNSKVRAFSHGCMRVRDPRRMAEVILKIGYEGATNNIVRRYWNSLENTELQLKHKIPVHVTYFTAWQGKDGEIHYFNDVYSHDKRVITVLNGGRVYLEPKQVIKQRIPRNDRYSSRDFDFWGFDSYQRQGFTSRRKKRNKRYKRRQANNFWGAQTPRKRKKQRRRNRKRYQSFDPFGLGW